jgi:hypothetical protein
VVLLYEVDVGGFELFLGEVGGDVEEFVVVCGAEGANKSRKQHNIYNQGKLP